VEAKLLVEVQEALYEITKERYKVYFPFDSITRVRVRFRKQQDCKGAHFPVTDRSFLPTVKSERLEGKAPAQVGEVHRTQDSKKSPTRQNTISTGDRAERAK